MAAFFCCGTVLKANFSVYSPKLKQCISSIKCDWVIPQTKINFLVIISLQKCTKNSKCREKLKINMLHSE